MWRRVCVGFSGVYASGRPLYPSPVVTPRCNRGGFTVTQPDWIRDSTVKWYAAEHLPVVRVKDGEPEIWPWDVGDGTSCWHGLPLLPSCPSDLSAAWERLCQKMRNGPCDCKVCETPPDGFYYLRPGNRELVLGDAVKLTPPTLVPCEDVSADYGLWTGTPESYLTVSGRTALIAYRAEKECDNPTNAQEGAVCPDCNDTGTIPEAVHCFTKEGAE